MSGWNSRSFFRSSQTRWRDEEAATDLLSNDSSPSWQPPPPYTPTSWDRTALNDELLTNEQRHFGDTVHDSNNELNTILAPQNCLTSTGASSHTLEWNQGYMEQPSSFAMDSPPTQSTFLESFPKGDATISFPGDNNALESLHNLEILLIQSRCPILGMAFERSRSGPQLYLETLTSATALPFLRYLYTGTYALRGLSGQVEDFYEDVPTSLLLHCQLYRLADIYDLPELKSQAYVNVLRQCEFGCSSPEKPIDLCAAIRFTYEHLREHANLIDAIINYCVSCFLRHRLAEDEEFKKLGFELRPFHQELCKNSMSREFEDDTAAAIIRMPFKPFIPETYKSREDPATDVVFHFHSFDELEDSPRKRKRASCLTDGNHKMTLPLRPREECTEAFKEEPSSGDEENLFTRKRRASSVAGPSIPVRGELSQLFSAQNNEPGLSGTEYEIVEAPTPDQEASDSETDLISFVKVKPIERASEISLTLPIRAREPAGGATTLTNARSDDSDSDWSLV